MHPFAQTRHDADVAVGQLAPIDNVRVMAEKETVDAERGRNRLRRNAARCDTVMGGEQADDAAIGRFAPNRSRM